MSVSVIGYPCELSIQGWIKVKTEDGRKIKLFTPYRSPQYLRALDCHMSGEKSEFTCEGQK